MGQRPEPRRPPPEYGLHYYIDKTSSQGMVVPLYTMRWQLCLVQHDYGGASEAYLDLSYNSRNHRTASGRFKGTVRTARLLAHRGLSNHDR